MIPIKPFWDFRSCTHSTWGYKQLFLHVLWTKENIGRYRIKQKHRAIEVPPEHCTLSLMYLLCLIHATDLTLSFISIGNAWLSTYRDYQAVNWHRLGISWTFNRSERNWEFYSSAVTEDLAHAPSADWLFKIKRLSMKELSSTVTRYTVAEKFPVCTLAFVGGTRLIFWSEPEIRTQTWAFPESCRCWWVTGALMQHAGIW